jgi:hypothetical protein
VESKWGEKMRIKRRETPVSPAQIGIPDSKIANALLKRSIASIYSFIKDISQFFFRKNN